MLSGVARHPRAVALGLLAVTAATSWMATRLEPSTELTTLLPESSSSAEAYRAVAEDFGNAEKVFVVVRSASQENTVPENLLLEATWRLEELLSDEPLVSSIRTGIGEADERFWLEAVVARAALLMPDEQFDRELRPKLTAEAIESRALWLRRLVSSSAAPPLVTLARSDPLGLFDADLAIQGGALPIEPLTGSFLSASGDVAMAIITPSARELDPAAGRQLASRLEAAEDTLRAEIGSVELLAVGGPLYAAHDQSAVRRDVIQTVTTSALASMLIMLLVFKSPWSPLAILVAVLAGMSWLFGALVMMRIEISALSLAFAAVLVGLGVDYGIHLGTRLRERRLASRDVASSPRAIWSQVLADTAPAIATSAVTTAAAFAVLTRAQLRLLSDLGTLVGLGILFILTATVTLGGALLVSAGSAEPQTPGRLWRALGAFASSLGKLGRRSPTTTLVVVLAASVLALPGVLRLEIETDLRNLRPQSSSLMVAERVVADSFGVGADTASVLVQGQDEDEALERARRATALLRSRLPAGSEVTSPSDMLIGPKTAAARLERLAELELDVAAARLESALREQRLDPRAFGIGLEALRTLGRGHDLPSQATLQRPDWLDDSISVDPSDLTRVILRVRLPKGSWDQGAPAALLRDLEDVAPGAGVATMPAIAADLEAAARTDLRQLGLFAVAVVTFIVIAAFRGSLWRSALAMVPVTLGSLWTLGLIGWLFGAIDLVGLAVLPIVLGIGIDDGLHALFGTDALRDVDERVRAAGRAMTVTTLTTSAGFGSLLLSDLPGVRRAGLAVTAGVSLCLLATLIVLPALSSPRLLRKAERVDR